jgi:hypothetical protein
MRQSRPARRRRFQYSLGTLLVVVTVAALSVRTLELVAPGVVVGVGLIVGVFAGTYWLLRDAQDRFQRNNSNSHDLSYWM